MLIAKEMLKKCDIIYPSAYLLINGPLFEKADKWLTNNLKLVNKEN